MKKMYVKEGFAEAFQLLYRPPRLGNSEKMCCVYLNPYSQLGGALYMLEAEQAVAMY